MEMHTKESIRRVHRIDVRKARAFPPVHRMRLAEDRILAEKVSNAYFRNRIVTAAAAVVAAVRKFAVAPIRQEIQCGNAMRELMRLTDRQLSDIGISRGDIRYVVRYGKPPIW